VIVASTWERLEFFPRRYRGVEDSITMFMGYDLVLLAVNDQQWGPHLSNKSFILPEILKEIASQSSEDR
jgi:hypothetical protein